MKKFESWKAGGILGFLTGVIIVIVFVLSLRFGFSSIYSFIGAVIYFLTFWVSIFGEKLVFLGLAFFVIEVSLIGALIGFLVGKKNRKRELFLRKINEIVGNN